MIYKSQYTDFSLLIKDSGKLNINDDILQSAPYHFAQNSRDKGMGGTGTL